MSLIIKNPKLKTEDFSPIVDFGVEMNVESIRDARALGEDIFDEFCKTIGKGIIEGLENMEIGI